MTSIARRAAVSATLALLLLAGPLASGCKTTQTASAPDAPGAPTTTAQQQAAIPARPSAADIQARIQKVQQDTQMPADAKAMLIGEMQHALGSPSTGRPAPGPPQ